MLGVIAIGAISFLEHRTHASRHSELTLLTVKVELNQLQTAPFRANAHTGGSPALASGLMRTGKELIDGRLAELRGQPSPPAALRAMQAPLRANFATLDQIYAVGITKAGYDERADRLSAVAGRSAGTDRGDARRRRARLRAPRGPSAEPGRRRLGAVILLLLLAFGVYYRRAAQARAVAAGLAQENAAPAGRQSRGGAHRRAHRPGQPPRAGQRPRRGAARAPSDERAARARALRPRRLQAVQRQLRPSGRRRAARPPGRAPEGGDRRASAASTGWAATSSACSPRSRPARATSSLLLAAEALSDAGDAFEIGCSHGLARIPAEAATPEEALRLADQRMYAHKADRPTIGRESTDLLLQVITERGAGLGEHLSGVARLAGDTAERLGLPEHEVRRIRLAAELHDVGKTAIPDTILNKPSALSDEEWEFMRRHTVIGERIIRAAPSLAHAAELVRYSHERFDGAGYPDALSGERDPARRQHHRRLRRLRRDGLRPALPRRRCRSPTPSPSCAAAPAPSSIPASSRPSARLWAQPAARWPRPDAGLPPALAAPRGAYSITEGRE